MIEKILNHEDLALERILEQYKCSENVTKLVKCFVSDVQNLESVSCQLLGLLDLQTQEGAQLDNIGRIVGQERMGYDDAFFRTLIALRIGINTSNGEPENAIELYRILSGSNIVHFQEYFDGNVGIFGDGLLDQNQLVFIAELLEDVLLGGVRIAALGFFDENCQFAFEGDPARTQGFGSVFDTEIGGCLGGLYQISRPFAFDGPDTEHSGFGSVFDPVIGGILESV